MILSCNQVVFVTYSLALCQVDEQQERPAAAQLNSRSGRKDKAERVPVHPATLAAITLLAADHNCFQGNSGHLLTHVNACTRYACVIACHECEGMLQGNASEKRELVTEGDDEEEEGFKVSLSLKSLLFSF